MAMAASSQHTRVTSTPAALCVSPSASFNPLLASDAQLLTYGLPTRPNASSAYFTQWVMAVTHAKKRGCENHMIPSAHMLPPKHGGTGQLNFQGYNWSGWQVNDTSYHVASGQWTIPCINTVKSPSNSDVGDWVGLGGQNGANLLQAGTYWDHTYRTWKAFYEEVGSGAHTAGVDEFASETCGHSMYADVDYGLTFSGQSYYLVEDLTSGGYWANYNNFVPTAATAEWIEEATVCDANQDWRLLADFGDVYWTNGVAGASYSGEHGISWWSREQLYSSSKPNPNDQTALAGPLYSSGEGFTDVFRNSGASAC